MKNYLTQSILYVTLITLAVSCGSNKKKEDVGYLGRQYQNLTAYYNGYYNANVILEEAIFQKNNLNPDDYQEILPIYPYLQDKDTSSAELRRAIDKLKKVIGLHEASDWVDDSYFLMGKAQFLKNDFESAENSLRWVVQEFSPEKLKKMREKRMSAKQKKKASQKKKNDLKKQKDQIKAQKAEEKKQALKDKKEAIEKQKKEEEEAKKEAAKEIKRKEAEAKKNQEDEARNQKREEVKSEKDKRMAESVQKRLDAQAAAEAKRQEVQRKRALAKKMAEDERLANQGKNGVDTSAITEQEIEQQMKEAEKVIEVASESNESESIKGKTDKNPDNDRLKIEEGDQNFEPAIKGKPKKYFLKHRPIFQEASLWLAKTYLARGNRDDAVSLLNKLKTDPETFDYIRREAYLTEANALISKKAYAQAIPNLENALEITKGKTAKARLNYILGQLYAETNQYDLAFQKFEEVEKLKPTYEMTFNAILNMYRYNFASNKISNDDLQSDLDKMLKDLKNEEYKDQIYFLKAEIAIGQNNIPLALTNLQKGVALSKKGLEAKSKSYLKIADILYHRDDFAGAYHYYDSTANGLPKDHLRYEEVLKRRDDLKDIAINLEIISLNDSLLMVGRMTTEQQEDLAKKIIKEKRLKDLQAQNASTIKATTGKNAPTLPIAGSNTKIGAGPISLFFAYDPKQVREGKEKFERTWGKRPLVDNWRQSSLIKNAIAEAEKENNDGVAAFFISKSEIADVLKDIPKNEGAINDLNNLIAQSMSSLGTLYPENIKRDDKAIEIYESLLSKYPKSAYEPKALYDLYFLYKARGDMDKANECAEILKSKYSGNQYSLYFSDPDYGKRKISKSLALNEFYNETYKLLDQRNYISAYEMAAQSDSLFGSTNSLRPKFLLVSALATANIKGKEDYVNALNDLVNKYPNSDEAIKAKEFLRLLGSGITEDEKKLAAAEKIYKEDPKDQHFILVVLKPNETNLEPMKLEVDNFNKTNFASSDLKIANISFVNKEIRNAIVVRLFESKIKGMEYYNQARNKGDFISPRYQYDIFCISNNNYRLLLANKDLEMYILWFNNHYRHN